MDQQAVSSYFKKHKPEYVFLAAAKVGGILANSTYPADFIYRNLMIQNSIIHQSNLHNVKRVLFLGSSCIYPKHCPKPIKEEYLMTGPLEPTNSPYAVAKIAGIVMFGPFLMHGIAPRHTVFLSIGFVFILIHFIRLLSAANRRTALIALIFIGLIISQGNAWNQFVVGRIQNDMFQYFQKNHNKLSHQKRIVIDTFSFSQHIPHNIPIVYQIDNFVDQYRLGNPLPLEKYYGARLFQSWGLRAIPKEIFGLSNVEIIFTSSDIERRNDSLYMKKWASASFGLTERENISVPQSGTAIVDFKEVYPTDWFPGKNFNYL